MGQKYYNQVIKLATVLVSVALPLLSLGKQLTPSEALVRCIDYYPELETRGDITTTIPVLTITSPNEETFNSIYIFNNENGFIIVSGDDSSLPLLGYSNSQNFNIESLNPELDWWLKEYALQIHRNSELNLSYLKKDTRGLQDKIEPLIRTKWDQDSPYWNKCPKVRNRHAYTGCGATALAQVMNYYKWPIQPVGEKISYRDYNQLIEWEPSEVTFQWDKMRDVYKKNEYTEEEAEAVADLMFGVGAAINTYFDITDSGAYEAIYGPALYKYFDYSPELKLVERDYYSKEDWESIIIAQLNKKQPVVYTGYDRSISYGHVFVCDGYDGNGYFHINWGWSGDGDGYYMLEALNWGDVESGSAKEEYNYYQHALIDILPSGATTELKPLILGNGNFKATGIQKDADKTTIELGSELKFFTANNYEEGVRNSSATPIEGYIGIRVENLTISETLESYSPSSVLLDVTYDDYMAPVKKNFSIKIPDNLTEGTYNIYPIFKIKDSNEVIDILYPLNSNKVLNMEVEGKVAVIGFGTNKDNAGVSKFYYDSTEFFDVYDMTGVKLLSHVKQGEKINLPSGYYILRGSQHSYKIKI